MIPAVAQAVISTVVVAAAALFVVFRFVVRERNAKGCSRCPSGAVSVPAPPRGVRSAGLRVLGS